MGKWIASQLLSENAEAEVGISPVCDGPESFSFGYRKAQQAICIGKKLFPQSAVSYVFYDDIKIFALLQESIDRDKAIAVVSELFDTVDQYDKANNSQLGQTFFELLINNLSTSHVSQQMFLHKNTVLQRKNKIAGFYDADPFEGPNHLRYELGFILKRLFEP